MFGIVIGYIYIYIYTSLKPAFMDPCFSYTNPFPQGSSSNPFRVVLFPPQGLSSQTSMKSTQLSTQGSVSSLSARPLVSRVEGLRGLLPGIWEVTGILHWNGQFQRLDSLENVGKEFHVLLKELLFFFCPTSTQSGDEFLPARRSTGVPQADKIRLHRGDLT